MSTSERILAVLRDHRETLRSNIAYMDSVTGEWTVRPNPELVEVDELIAILEKEVAL
jgi:hypothetical protein